MTFSESIYNFFLSCPYIDGGLNLNRFDSVLPSFSVNFLPDIKTVRKYVDGSSLEKISFDLVCNRRYGKNATVNSDNFSLFELISLWIDSQSSLGNLPESVLAMRAESFPSLAEGLSTISSARYSVRCHALRRRPK